MATRWIAMTEMGPRVTPDDVRRYERELGQELPEDYRQFLVDVNGGQPALECSVFQLRKDRSILNNLLSLNDPDEGNDLATVQRLSAYSGNELPKDALTIGYDAGGSRILLILAGPHRGQVWFLDIGNLRPTGSNLRVEWFDRRDAWKLADSFAEFMASLKPLEAAS
jgi:cell wall assembly regulator SMI1